MLRLINKKRKCRHKFEDSGSKASYRRACADVKSAIKKFHVQQESELLSQHDRRNLYTYVNYNLGNKNNQPVEITLSGGSKSNDITTILRPFSDEFNSNFNAHMVASSCPAGNADGLRFSSNIEDVQRLLAATP